MLTKAIAGLPPFVSTYMPSFWPSISATMREKLSRASVSGTIRSIGTLTIKNLPPSIFRLRMAASTVNLLALATIIDEKD